MVETECTWCRGTGAHKNGRECFRCRGSGKDIGWQNRHYNVFAILANVRIGYFNPISKPRGLPLDMSKELMKIAAGGESNYDALIQQYGAGWLGEHSYSHLTLRELLEYNWHQVSTYSGIVSPQEFNEYVTRGKPNTWCGDVGSDVIRLTNNAMSRLCLVSLFKEGYQIWGDPDIVNWSPGVEAALSAEGVPVERYKAQLQGDNESANRITLVTEISWSETYKDAVGVFYTKFLPTLTQYAIDHGFTKDNVRLVFGFDS